MPHWVATGEQGSPERFFGTCWVCLTCIAPGVPVVMEANTAIEVNQYKSLKPENEIRPRQG